MTAYPMHELRAAVDRERARRAWRRELWWLRAGIVVSLAASIGGWWIVYRVILGG